MTEKIRIGIVGYGNLGKGAEKAVKYNPDFELVKIFAVQTPNQLEEMKEYIGKIDIMLLCIGSATDLPQQTPEIAKLFNTVDTFDTHAKIPEYFAAVDQAARQSDKLSMISTGWDPGLFSIMRAMMEAAVPAGKTYTFWGRGVSQGHSEAMRRLPGVLDAREYTIPVEATLEEVRKGDMKEYTPRQMHKRECYVVAEKGADLAELEKQIVTMPNYFEPYDTTVTFVDMASFQKEHSALPHGGFVIRSGITGEDSNKELMEFFVKLECNPEFTSSVMLSFCRAAWRLYKDGRRGAVTAFDVPIGYLSIKDSNSLRESSL